jgi:adenylate kinase family enzyme
MKPKNTLRYKGKIINKLYILGTSGSGKSKLADKLSKILKIKIFNLDDIFWLKKYTKKRDFYQRKKKLKALLKKNQEWIIEGVFTDWSKEAIQKANMLIWIDLPKRILSYRIFKRYLKRRNQKKETLKDCIELIKYARSYKKSSGTTSYTSHKKTLQNSHAKKVIIRNKRDLKKLFEILK